MTVKALKEQGFTEMPVLTGHTVTVPGYFIHAQILNFKIYIQKLKIYSKKGQQLHGVT